MWLKSLQSVSSCIILYMDKNMFMTAWIVFAWSEWLCNFSHGASSWKYLYNYANIVLAIELFAHAFE